MNLFKSKSKKEKIYPVVIHGDYAALWNDESNHWEFEDDNYAYTFYNSKINTALFDQLPKIENWINELDDQINEVIDSHTSEISLDRDTREVVSIEVTQLLEKQQIDVTYDSDDWGDLGVYIVIRSGTIVNSYACD